MDDDSEAVLKKIMDDGTFDELRQKLVEHLKKNEELQQFTQDKVLNSKTLQAESARKMSKKDLFDNLRKELENTVLEQALKATWAVLGDDAIGMPKLIDTKVHEALCAVHEERAAVRSNSAT
ncbi:g3843 [Coccomyxa elongata]